MKIGRVLQDPHLPEWVVSMRDGGRRAGRDCSVIEVVLFLGPIPSLQDPHLPEWVVSMDKHLSLPVTLS
jgi:hypothetical protein